MNSIDIRHFVDINIINKKVSAEVASTRETVALFTLDDKFAPITGDVEYAEYNSLQEIEAVSDFADSDKSKAIYKYAKVFFDNGGIKLRLINPNFGNNGTPLTEITYSDVLPFVKALPNEIIVVGVVNATITNNLSTITALANEYNNSIIDGFAVYGINEKYFIANQLYTAETESITYTKDTDSITVAFADVKNLAIKLIDQTNQIGGEMTIAAYLSQIDVYKTNAVKDYQFTQEIITKFNVSNMNSYVSYAINNHKNITIDINGINRNIGGDLTTGEDLVNKYALIILHQTLSQRVFEVLSQKLKGNDAITAIYAAMSRELNRYIVSGYLTTDKTWTNDDLTIVKNNTTYTLITKGTALVQGYKITILPYASLTSAEISQHKVPYIYVVLADSYNIRKATIYGETI